MRYISTGFLTITAVLFICNFSPETWRNESSQIFIRVQSLYRYFGIDTMVLSSLKQDNSPPAVKILSPAPGETVSWNTQVRFEISVSDEEDGESRYGEINPDEVMLEVEYLSGIDESSKKEKLKKSRANRESPGLSLIITSTCFSCHRDEARLVGPSFSEIARRYKQEPSTIVNLGARIIEGSSGRWGNAVMPANSNLSHEEAMEIASYILDLGADQHRSIYPGLEGVFRVMEKPVTQSPGAILMTASYTDHGIDGETDSRKRGVCSVIIDLR